MKRNLIYLTAIALSAVGIAAYVGLRNHTSINPKVQSVFQSKIDGAITEYKAKGAVAILMNAKNGEIVAMYSAPNDKSILNQTFEFGSILSLANPILAMENGIDANRQYDVSKPFTPTDKSGADIATIRDTFTPTQSSMNITEITINSSNIGSAQIALDLPQNAYGELFARLCMNAPLNLDFGQSAAPNIPSQWRKIDRIHASLGHGVFITPIHLMAASNAIINDGIYVAPWTTTRPQSGERVIASEHSAVIRDIMHKIAVKVWNDEMNVGIKSASSTQTGTKDIVTSVFATFPIDNPKYSLLIIVDSPQQHKTAAWNAVPLTKSILTEIMPML